MQRIRSIHRPFLVAALTLGALSFSAHAAESLKAGIYPSYPPLDMRDPATNELTGFDVELGKALSTKLGRPVDWVETNFAELIAATTTGRIEIFFNGMDDTPARQQQIAFVDYLRSGSQFLTMASSNITTPKAVCGKKVGISRLTNDPAVFARWNAATCEKAGLPAAVYMPAENSVDARSQMKQGRTDVVMMDSLTIPYIIQQNQGAFKTVGEPVEFQPMGIGVAKGDKALQLQVADAMQKLIDDGSYARLLDKWGLSASSAIPKVTINNAPLR
ncbi:ABC transporter substrate-binding protein [Paraburkholderia sp.]|uniref:ABC transporter substrate-binding protein n=1 Tax=Paraburkholderia sp. TaxID=1926495 RepID=UPI0039E33213